MKFALPPPRKKARVEIIPMIDVIFFLLATFVLVSLSMTRLQGINVDLPQGVPPKQDQTDQPEVVTISVLADGSYAWEKRQMTWVQVIGRMNQYRRESPDPRILINGEESANFGNALILLDEARKMGIEKVSLKTKLQPVELD